MDPGLQARLRRPVELDDGPVTVDRCRVVDTAEERSVVEVTLHEGRNRIVRRLFEALGHPVQRLVRTQVGPVRLRGLATGQLREVTGKELQSLYTRGRLVVFRMCMYERCAERPRCPQTNGNRSWKPSGSS